MRSLQSVIRLFAFLSVIEYKVTRSILLMARPSSRQIWRSFHALLCLTTLVIFAFGDINSSMKPKFLRMGLDHTTKRIVVVGGGAAGYFGAVEVCLPSRNVPLSFIAAINRTL